MRELLRILLPLLVWLASFSAIYGLHGLGCALGWPEVAWLGLSLFRWALLIAWLAAIVLQLLLLLTVGKWSFGPTTDFIWANTACGARLQTSSLMRACR